MSLHYRDLDAINIIGRDAGIQLWDDLTGKEQNEAYTNDQEKHYYKGVILPANDKYPPMLIFQTIGEYGYYPGSSNYCINLKSGKPTSQSGIKKIPRRDLILRIYDNGENVLHNYFKKITSS